MYFWFGSREYVQALFVENVKADQRVSKSSVGMCIEIFDEHAAIGRMAARLQQYIPEVGRISVSLHFHQGRARGGGGWQSCPDRMPVWLTTHAELHTRETHDTARGMLGSVI